MRSDGDPILVSAAPAPGEARRAGSGSGVGSRAGSRAGSRGGPAPGRARSPGSSGSPGHGIALPPALLAGAGRTPEGAVWLTRLPALVDRAAHRWGLALGEPFAAGSASWCAPARDAAGRDLVLKVSFPHDEARHEAAVLRAWAGRGAVPLVDAHDADRALLLGRARPGTPLRVVRSPVTRRLAEAADVLRVLHATPPPAGLPTLAEVAARLADLLAERAGRAAAAGVRPDPGLLRLAGEVLRGDGADRAGPAGVPVTLHGDFNPGNVLRVGTGRGARWVAIDPKALSGDAAYDAWPLLEQVGAPWRTDDPVRTLRDRLVLVADRAGLDAAGAARWSVARGTEVALWVWHHGAGRPAAAREVDGALARARDWARVADLLAG